MSLSDEIIARKTRNVVKPTKLFDAEGLFLLVNPNGGKWWRLKYRFGGREKQLSFGVYPNVSIGSARASRDVARSLIANGVDPGEQAKVERNAKREKALRQLAATRFMVDNDGALSFRLGRRCVALTPGETIELRAFLKATCHVMPKD